MSYIVYGTSITFQCVINAWPIPAITWFKNGGPLPLRSKLRNVTNNRETTSHLEIEDANLLDAGNYSCKAENMFGTEMVHMVLEIISK